MANTDVVEKQPLTEDYLKKMDAYWRATNYLGAAQLYLLDNPLLREPLTMEHVKKKIVGHWGTVPGQNFIYVHLNRVIKKYDQDMILISGPGHGGNFFVANTYLEGTYSFLNLKYQECLNLSCHHLQHIIKKLPVIFYRNTIFKIIRQWTRHHRIFNNLYTLTHI